MKSGRRSFLPIPPLYLSLYIAPSFSFFLSLPLCVCVCFSTPHGDIVPKIKTKRRKYKEIQTYLPPCFRDLICLS